MCCHPILDAGPHLGICCRISRGYTRGRPAQGFSFLLCKSTQRLPNAVLTLCFTLDRDPGTPFPPRPWKWVLGSHKVPTTLLLPTFGLDVRKNPWSHGCADIRTPTEPSEGFEVARHSLRPSPLEKRLVWECKIYTKIETNEPRTKIGWEFPRRGVSFR